MLGGRELQLDTGVLFGQLEAPESQLGLEHLLVVLALEPRVDLAPVSEVVDQFGEGLAVSVDEVLLTYLGERPQARLVESLRQHRSFGVSIAKHRACGHKFDSASYIQTYDSGFGRHSGRVWLPQLSLELLILTPELVDLADGVDLKPVDLVLDACFLDGQVTHDSLQAILQLLKDLVHVRLDLKQLFHLHTGDQRRVGLIKGLSLPGVEGYSSLSAFPAAKPSWLEGGTADQRWLLWAFDG